MTLHLLTKGSDVDDIIFSLADQINHGSCGESNQSSELRFDFANINELAGNKAVELSDFATARSYLSVALSLLPSDHWQSHYDRSLRVCFLLAKSCYSCGNAEKGYSIAQTIISEAHNLNDKLDAYYLVVEILHDREALEEAYSILFEILSQLGEAIPDSFGPAQTKEMTKTTAKVLSGLTEESLSGMKKIDKKHEYILKYYAEIASTSFTAKPAMTPFFVCRICQITMKHGVCRYSILGKYTYI